MPDIGTGPLMCIRSVACPGCGEGVTQGCMYECEDLIEPSLLMLLILGGCGCGQEHPYVVVKGKTHAYCPNCFAPLGDPDAVIKETDEPKVVAPVRPITATEVRALQRERYRNV